MRAEAVALRELPPLQQLTLRGEAAVLGALLAIALPLEPNTTAAAAGRVALWLGPDEWLLVGGTHDVRQLRQSLAGARAAVVDVSASRSVLELAGARASSVLAKAATLDFHIRAFGVGRCAQTNLARTQGIVHRVGAAQFHLYVRNSFARYLSAWLRDAMAEYTAGSHR
jgi:sarcosine oxidase subunit gamma